jgi:hypothetical protein
MDEFKPGTTRFTGIERDGRGEHRISRVTCNGCGIVLSQMHYMCCGYSSCGTSRTTCDCAKEKSDGEVGL